MKRPILTQYALRMNSFEKLAKYIQPNMASDRGQNGYSDFVALETLLRFENCSSSPCLLSSWRWFHVFESPYPTFHRTVFFGAPLAFLRGVAMGLCRRWESLRHFYVFVSSGLPFVDCATYLTAVSRHLKNKMATTRWNVRKKRCPSLVYSFHHAFCNLKNHVSSAVWSNSPSWKFQPISWRPTRFHTLRAWTNRVPLRQQSKHLERFPNWWDNSATIYYI